MKCDARSRLSFKNFTSATGMGLQHSMNMVCVCVCVPERLLAAGVQGWMACLPGRGSEMWAVAPWGWDGSQNPPDN